MKYGKYWDDSQIVVGAVVEADRIPSAVFKGGPGAPAFIATIIDAKTRATIEHMFVETVPGTEHDAQIVNPTTGKFEFITFVNVNIYAGPTLDYADMKHVMSDDWPLCWFLLTTLPPMLGDPYDAYARAMSIVGVRK